jgi:hypothetical protein
MFGGFLHRQMKNLPESSRQIWQDLASKFDGHYLPMIDAAGTEWILFSINSKRHNSLASRCAHSSATAWPEQGRALHALVGS